MVVGAFGNLHIGAVIQGQAVINQRGIARATSSINAHSAGITFVSSHFIFSSFQVVSVELENNIPPLIRTVQASKKSNFLFAFINRHSLPRQLVGAFVFRVSGVAFDPVPFDIVGD
jgi:hypothetical protein